MKPVQALLSRYEVNEGWADPFAGLHSPAELRNDIEPYDGLTHNMDGLDFLKSLPSTAFRGVVFDPPYSVDQCLRCYTPKFKGTAGRTEYRARCKDEIARIIREDGVAISFGWDSTGIGIKRGFTIIEIILLCHGACHNDTIITVERKTPGLHAVDRSVGPMGERECDEAPRLILR
jgi:hypothetical protein